MWSVDFIAWCLIFIANISAGMHLKEPLRRQHRVQIQEQELEAEIKQHHHIQDIEKAGWVILIEHVMYNWKE